MTDETSSPAYPRRGIRSYVRREGRITEGQRAALANHWASYGIDITPSLTLDFETLYPTNAPVVLEIGFGDGLSLFQQAQNFPQYNYLGIEVHRPGVGRLLAHLAQDGLTHVKVICADAVEVLRNNIANESLSAVQLFFPDPWHKKRHHKRRMVQPEWASLVAQKLRIGGRIHLATDWEPYAEHMMAVLSAHPNYQNSLTPGTFAPCPPERSETKFQRRGERLGHGVWDLIFQKT